MGVDKIIVCKEGENYSKNDNRNFIGSPLFKDINKCAKPFTKLKKEETISINSIQNFVDNWIYTSDNDIPPIDSNNKKFFTKSIMKMTHS